MPTEVNARENQFSLTRAASTNRRRGKNLFAITNQSVGSRRFGKKLLEEPVSLRNHILMALLLTSRLSQDRSGRIDSSEQHLVWRVREARKPCTRSEPLRSLLFTLACVFCICVFLTTDSVGDSLTNASREAQVKIIRVVKQLDGRDKIVDVVEQNRIGKSSHPLGHLTPEELEALRWIFITGTVMSIEGNGIYVYITQTDAFGWREEELLGKIVFLDNYPYLDTLTEQERIHVFAYYTPDSKKEVRGSMPRLKLDCGRLPTQKQIAEFNAEQKAESDRKAELVRAKEAQELQAERLKQEEKLQIERAENAKREAEKAAIKRSVYAFKLKQAERGLADYQYEVGLQLLRGDGVPKDESKGREWLQKAAAQGYERAKDALVDALKSPARRP
jgi:hypothetical protein